MQNKNTPTPVSASAIIAILTMFAPACGPCEAEIVTVGIIELCDGGEDSAAESTSTATTATTGEPVTDGGSESSAATDTSSASTGGDCNDAPDFGEPWGACPDGACPGSPGTTFCVMLGGGTVCLPACGEGECPAMPCASSGQCLVDGECAPTCSPGPEPTGCPFDGMVCAPGGAGVDAGICVWP